jgi:hypothetical protein
MEKQNELNKIIPMKLKLPFTYFLMLLMILLSNTSAAQDVCDDIITQARKEYEKGQFQQLIDDLKNCKKLGVDKVTLWQSYKLIAMSYLQLNNPEKARLAAIKMLEANPQYKPSRLNDEKEFIHLIKSIPVIPRFTLTISGIYGLTFTSVHVINSFNVTDMPKSYNGRSGFDAGILMDYYFSKHIAMQAGLFTAKYKYNFKYEQMDFGSVTTGSEHLNYFEFPLLFKYTAGEGKLQPYIQLGAFYGYLNTDYLNLSITDDQGMVTNSKDNAVKDLRKKSNWGLLYGLGISYKLVSGSLFLDYRLMNGLTNIYKTEISRYRNNHQDLMFNYYFIPDDLRLNNSVISAGYSFYISYKVIRNQKYKFL